MQTTLLAAWETQRNLAAPTNTTPWPLIRSVSRGLVASLSDNRAPYPETADAVPPAIQAKVMSAIAARGTSRSYAANLRVTFPHAGPPNALLLGSAKRRAGWRCDWPGQSATGSWPWWSRCYRPPGCWSPGSRWAWESSIDGSVYRRHESPLRRRCRDRRPGTNRRSRRASLRRSSTARNRSRSWTAPWCRSRPPPRAAPRSALNRRTERPGTPPGSTPHRRGRAPRPFFHCTWPALRKHGGLDTGKQFDPGYRRVACRLRGWDIYERRPNDRMRFRTPARPRRWLTRPWRQHDSRVDPKPPQVTFPHAGPTERDSCRAAPEPH